MAKKADRAKQKIPDGESKADKFKRVVSPRVSKAIKAIGLISYCAGSAYENTDDEVNAILAALNTAVDKMHNSYMEKVDKQDSFSFGE